MTHWQVILIFLSLNFFICKVGMIISTSWGCYEDDLEDNAVSIIEDAQLMLF